MNVVRDEQPEQVTAEVKFNPVLNTSVGRIDISDTNSITEIKNLLIAKNVPLKERKFAMNMIKAKVKSGDLYFYQKAEIATDETPANIENVDFTEIQ